MINFFQFAQSDDSLDYLGRIFGSMGGVLNPTGGGGVSISLLGTMFKTFNATILAVGALIVVYITVVGVLQTAHEGEFMGKKWSNLWIPIRTVLGIAALVPTGSGYSGIQIVMMWIIVQGIGAADTLWNTVLGYVQLVGSPYAQVTLPSTGAYQTINALFQGLACDASAKITKPDPSNLSHGGYFCAGGSGWCGSFALFDPTKSTYTMGPGGACGTLHYCDQASACGNPNSLKCVACKGQVDALSKIVPTLAVIANDFVQADYTYREFYYTSYKNANKASWSWIYSYCSAQNPPIPQNECCVPSKIPGTCKANGGKPGASNFPDPNDAGLPQNPSNQAVKNLYWEYNLVPNIGNVDFISTAVSYYSDQLAAQVNTFIQAQAQNTNNLSGPLADASKHGWIVAGGYYYYIAQQNSNNLEDSMPTMTMVSSDPSQTPMNNYRNNYQAAATLMGAAAGTSGMFASSPQMSAMGGVLGSVNKSTGGTFSTNISGKTGSDPLSQLQIAGMVMLITAQILFVALIALTLVLGIAGFLDFFSLGTGLINPAGPTIALLYFLLIPMLFGLLGILVSVGGMLAVYTPLIPYIIYTFGAIGWMASTIEAMVAGPLVALGILSPSGQHELLGKAEPALMLIFHVFLRPSLMIFGLMAGMLMATVVVDMINAAFWTTVASGIGGGSAAGIYANPLELVIYVSAYVTLICTALNKCFDMIRIVPEKVFDYIGGHGAQYGEAEALGQVKGATEKASGKAGGAMQAGKGTTEKAGKARGKTQTELDEKRKAGSAGTEETKDK